MVVATESNLWPAKPPPLPRHLGNLALHPAPPACALGRPPREARDAIKPCQPAAQPGTQQKVQSFLAPCGVHLDAQAHLFGRDSEACFTNVNVAQAFWSTADRWLTVNRAPSRDLMQRHHFYSHSPLPLPTSDGGKNVPLWGLFFFLTTGMNRCKGDFNSSIKVTLGQL